MRVGGAVAVLMLVLVAATAGSTAARAQTRALEASCAKGAKAAVVGGNFKCLKVGAACLAKHQADYRRYGFTCVSGKLRKKSATAKTGGAGSTGVTTAPPAPPTPAPPVVAAGTDRAHPIPLGQPGNIGGGWTVTVTGVSFDAWPAIGAANMFNTAPASGVQDVMVSVSATYTGSGSSHLDSDYALRAVGASNVAYTSFGNSCGVLPDPNLSLADPEVFSGGTVSGNAACWQVSAADVGSLEMFAQPLLGQTQVWFALR